MKKFRKVLYWFFFVILFPFWFLAVTALQFVCWVDPNENSSN